MTSRDEPRQYGRQGPRNDPNRDGCGPAVLLLVLAVLAVLAAVLA